MRFLAFLALLLSAFACTKPSEWTPEQRAAASSLGIQIVGLGAQGLIGGWREDEWRQFGHVGAAAITDLALRMGAPSSAEMFAQYDPEVYRALSGQAPPGLPGGDSNPGPPPS